jgi:hypothetical protein
MALGRVRPVFIDLVLIFAIWSILIGTMLVLQGMGLDFGFQIWPFGEFRNWIELLQDGPGFAAAKLFWVLDHRNGLSPWWYLAARPLIESISAAPLILHLLAGLFVGFFAYLLFTELTHSRHFGLSVGILSALFIPNVHRDDVIWNLVGAVGCTLLSIWLFAVFCKDRRQSGFLAASYVAWFVAFSTYSLQVGAIGAIFFVSLRQRLRLVAWPSAVIGAVFDILPYAGLFVLFLMLWITAMPAIIPYQFQFSAIALAKSIGNGIWHQSYYFFWTWLAGAGLRLMMVVFVLLSLAILALVRALRVGDYVGPTKQALCFALLIGACVTAPTVVLEATSDVWIPGTRWPMLMQFWSPFLFCVMLFAAMPALPHGFRPRVWQSATACAAAFSIVLGLGFNHTQVVHVRQERAFFTKFQSVVTKDRASGAKFPRRYLIQSAEPAPFIPPPGRLADAYAHTLLGRDVTFELVEAPPNPPRDHTFLIWKDQGFSRPSNAMPGETSAVPSVQP